MSIETIGEAHSLGWRVIARCAYSRGDGPSSKSSRECIYRKELDMETLVWTRGRTFPLSRLESRLSCPQCGSRSAKIGNRYVTADSLWQQGGRSEAWRSCTTGKERRITRWEHEHVLE